MRERADDAFDTTHWTVVLQAGSAPGPEREAALAALCRYYWQPVFVYIRRQGKDEEAARDLTQEFFSRLLEKEWLEGLRREGSRFRAFLLVAVKRFLAVEHHRQTAQKRGRGATALSLDKEQLPVLASQAATPEEAYDRHWALTVINRALSELQHETEAAGRSQLFTELAEYIANEPEPGAYDAAAAVLGMSRSAVAMAVHRLRLRLREKIRHEVAHTLADTRYVEDEMHELMAALRR